MVREIRGAKINPKSSFKKWECAKYAGAEITRANTVYNIIISLGYMFRLFSVIIRPY